MVPKLATSPALWEAPSAMACVAFSASTRSNLGHIDATDGIELAKVHRLSGVPLDLGHLDATGGIELTKIAERMSGDADATGGADLRRLCPRSTERGG